MSPIDNLRIVWLRAFVIASETKSFSVTAEKLGCSQPQASRYVKAFEDWCGHALLERRRGLSLTKEGEAIEAEARAALELIEAVHDTLNNTIRRSDVSAFGRWAIGTDILKRLSRSDDLDPETTQRLSGWAKAVFDESPSTDFHDPLAALRKRAEP